MAADMPNSLFFEQPIINSPYRKPERHWALDADGQPTQQVNERRRDARFVTPIPRPSKQAEPQAEIVFDEGHGLSSADQQYQDVAALVTNIRREVEQWRAIPDERDWGVTAETARLLRHWRDHPAAAAGGGIRPFFCQVEAAETMIWLTEVAPGRRGRGARFLQQIEDANREANPELTRYALKLATGAGKTTVMAMIIAWQTVNAMRHPRSNRFTRGFLIVTPGITIKDRLRVLQPNDPDSYYQSRNLVPSDMLADLDKAKIVITNFHAFKPRETINVSKGGRALLRGRGPELNTTESDGQMARRVMPELMGIPNVLALNDEGHHCYRRRPGGDEEPTVSRDEQAEVKKNTEEARLWISGLEAVNAELGLQRVIDLSATPFFLRGSGYAEGTLFPWTVTDFSLMDAIECGIVKLPRVPVADNIASDEMPTYRALWQHIREDMPKKGRGKSAALDPRQLPIKLQSALDALYGHYEKAFQLWREAQVPVPPCFVIVCNNTATSKLVYDYIAGFRPEPQDGAQDGSGDPRPVVPGRLPLFRNFSDDGAPLARPNTLLIDSEQLESGDALESNFRSIAADEIERFRRERLQRSGDQRAAADISDQDLLREVMNTVGKPGTLGASIRCVVSVSMLTEGWDANTVTHVLGVRAFGTQLLCEQVVGRALRRQSYELNDEGLFNVEYADVLGIPFDFTATPVVAPPQQPRRTIHVHAVSPERDHLAIGFPRVRGYRIEPPPDRLEARFTEDSRLELTPELTGPTITHSRGIIGEGVDLTTFDPAEVRRQTLIMQLTQHLLLNEYRDANDEPMLHLYGKLKRLVDQWFDDCLTCIGGTSPAQLMYLELAEMACEKIAAAITRAHEDERPVKAVLDPYNPVGSTAYVNFTTSRESRWQTNAQKCHVNWAILDSHWEAEFCRLAEQHPRVLAYVKNHNLGLEVPYRIGGSSRIYIPDFIVQLDDGRGPDDPLNVIVEIKGFRGEDAKVKKETMETYWVPGVNNLRAHGRWAFAEYTDLFSMAQEFTDFVDAATAV